MKTLVHVVVESTGHSFDPLTRNERLSQSPNIVTDISYPLSPNERSDSQCSSSGSVYEV